MPSSAVRRPTSTPISTSSSYLPSTFTHSSTSTSTNISRTNPKLVPLRASKYIIYDADDIQPQRLPSTHIPQDDDENTHLLSLPTHLLQQRPLRQQLIDTSLCATDISLITTSTTHCTSSDYSTTDDTSQRRPLPTDNSLQRQMDAALVLDTTPIAIYSTPAAASDTSSTDSSQRRPAGSSQRRPLRTNQDLVLVNEVQNNNPLPDDDTSSLVRGRLNE